MLFSDMNCSDNIFIYKSISVSDIYKKLCGSLVLSLSEFYDEVKFERNARSCFNHLSLLVTSPHFLIKQ